MLRRGAHTTKHTRHTCATKNEGGGESRTRNTYDDHYMRYRSDWRTDGVGGGAARQSVSGRDFDRSRTAVPTARAALPADGMATSRDRGFLYFILFFFRRNRNNNNYKTRKLRRYINLVSVFSVHSIVVT